LIGVFARLLMRSVFCGLRLAGRLNSRGGEIAAACRLWGA